MRGQSWLTGLVAVLALLLAAACGEPQRVGSERLEQFDEQEDVQRLGEALQEDPDSDATQAARDEGRAGVVAEEATPAPTAPPAQQQAAEQFFDVQLIDRSPYYDPGNQLVMAAGMTLRVTNSDRTAERPQRSFTSRDGSFDSGLLAPGETWTHRIDAPGYYEIVDRRVPFMTASLEVR